MGLGNQPDTRLRKKEPDKQLPEAPIGSSEIRKRRKPGDLRRQRDRRLASAIGGIARSDGGLAIGQPLPPLPRTRIV